MKPIDNDALDSVCGGFDLSTCVSHMLLGAETAGAAGATIGAIGAGPVGLLAGGSAGLVGGLVGAAFLSPACAPDASGSMTDATQSYAEPSGAWTGGGDASQGSDDAASSYDF